MRLFEFVPDGRFGGNGGDGEGFNGNLPPGNYALSDQEFYGYLNSGRSGLGHLVEDYINDMVTSPDEDSFIFEIESVIEDDINGVPNFDITGVDFDNQRTWYITVRR